MIAKCAGAALSGTKWDGACQAPGVRAARDGGPAPAAPGGAVRGRVGNRSPLAVQETRRGSHSGLWEAG